MRTDGAIITNAGQELLSYALANNKQVNFTKVKLGKGDVNTFDEAKKLTDVVSFYKQIPITSIARNNAGVVRIRSSFTNTDFPLQVVLKEIGVFAVVEGKSEVLFGYVNDGEGESFPPGSSGNIVERVRDIYIGVSTNTQVTAVVDRSVVYATIYDLDEEIAKCAKKITRVNPGNGIHGGGTLGEDVTVSIKSNDTSINLDAANGITLKKTTSWLNDAAQLFTAKGALNLFNTLTTNFTDAINTAKEALRVDISRKEDKFGKNSGFNREKTDLVENDTNKVFSAKGAFDLKNWLVENYTTLMNNIRESLTNMINTKTPHGGYGKSSQDLKNDIDNKVSLYASAPFLGIHRAGDALHWYLDADRFAKFWDTGNFNPNSKLDKGAFKGDAYNLAYSDNVTPGHIGDTQEAIDKITTPGRYVCGASNGPYHLARLEVKEMLDTHHIMQEIYQWNGPRKFRVAYNSNFVGIPWITTYTEQNFTPANKMDKGGYGGTGLDLYNIATSKVSSAGDRMTGKLEIVTSGGNGVEIIEGVSNNPRITFHNSNTRISLGEHPSHTTDFPLVVMDSNGNNPQRLYHQSFKPTPQEIGAFRLEGVLNAIPKTYSGATQVQNGSPDFAEVGGGSQHFLIQMTTENTYEQNAYVGQIAWGYSPNDPRIAIRCKAPGVDGRWEQLVRAKDLANHCPYRIGDMFDTTNAQHPAETYLGTQWERYGDGRVIIGLSESETEFNVIGKTGGTKTEALTADQNGPHDHPFTTVIGGNGWYGQGGNLGPFGTIKTGASGAGAPHNNLQPYIVAYRWRRIV